MKTADENKEISPVTDPKATLPSRFRMRLGLTITLLGFVIFMIGAHPQLFGLDRSPVVGFVQIAVFLVGLAWICVGGYISLMVFWRNGDRTIPAEIGPRLVATGYVISVFAGMADIFGLGTRPPPEFVPYFGYLQAIGVESGMGIILVGLLLLVPFTRRKSSS